ncbi:hypothetical protein CTAYLR_003907 [Chrysophaeum taylorii]|uniref:Sel1 repeat family protein n=1 Tax=Chrysophaeum taylorii TaxID=2483200 RepID=A0AAD7U9E4_9STRA|nr:hypothetical protein CTAYLR_003907 [Chrysophaeum taylorii]
MRLEEAVRVRDIQSASDAQAQRGDGRAAFNAGLMRARGVGCEPDRALALKWLIKAANKGVVKAQTQLAYLYATGRGGATRNDAEAMRWYQAAAEAGDVDALYKLGGMYKQGLGSERDNEAAVRCWSEAAAAGHVKAAERLRTMAPRPDEVDDQQPGQRRRGRGSLAWLCCSCMRRYRGPPNDEYPKRTTTQSPLVEPLLDAQPTLVGQEDEDSTENAENDKPDDSAVSL